MALAGLGVAPGDRVAIVRHNDVTFVTAYLGVLWAGAVAVPLNPLAPPRCSRRRRTAFRPGALLRGPGTDELVGFAGAVPVSDVLDR